MSLEELMRIELSTASKKNEKISDIPASVKIITRKEIETFGYQNLEEVLENVIGLYIIDNNTFHYITVGVRGYWTQLSRNVVVMINGINQLEEFHADYPNTWGIPVESIDRIEIIRGPMSVIYGTGAFFGAINIITNQVTNSERSSIVSATYGTDNTAKVQAKIAHKTDDINFAFNGGIFHTDGLNVPYNELTSHSEQLSEWGVTNSTTKGKYKRDQKYFDLSVRYRNFYFEINNKNIIRGFNYTQPHPSEEPYVKQLMTNTFAGYKNEFSKAYLLDVRFTYSIANSKYHLVWGNDTSPYPYSESVSEFYEFEVINFINPIPKLNITLGLNYHNSLKIEQSGDFGSLNNYLLKYDDKKANTMAVYSQINYDITEKLKTIIGLRLERLSPFDIYYYGNQQITDPFGKELGFVWKDHIDRSELNLVPQLAFIYKLNENNTFKFLYGQAIMHPDILSDFDVMRQRFEYMDMNLNTNWLESEKISTYELNYQSFIALNAKARLGLNLSLFNNILKNLFSRKEQVINGEFITQSVNEGELKSNGLEASIRLENQNLWNVHAGVSYQYIEDKKNNRDLGYSPNTLGYLRAVYFLTNDFSFGMSGLYVNEMLARWNNSPSEKSPTLDPNDPSYIPVGRIGANTKAYLKIGFNIRYNNLITKGVYLNLKISNLFDAEIRTPVDDSNIWVDKGMLSYGRQFFINLGYKF